MIVLRFCKRFDNNSMAVFMHFRKMFYIIAIHKNQIIAAKAGNQKLLDVFLF